MGDAMTHIYARYYRFPFLYFSISWPVIASAAAFSFAAAALGAIGGLSVPVGCIIGYGMAHLMTEMFSSDLFRLPFAPSRASYGWSIVIVLAAALVTAMIVARRVQHLDLVRVLKARD